MKVLMISGDPRILLEGSEAYARLALQRASVEKLDVFVWPQVHSWRDIRAAANMNSYDVVTAQDPFWRGLLAWRIARRAHMRLNLQVHTDLSSQPIIRHMLSSFFLRRADSVRVVSEKIKEQVKAMGARARISVLPVYIDVARYRTVSPRPHEQKTILWVGRFEREKDPLLAIAVLKEVLKKGVDAKLIMVGDGSLKSKVSQEASGLPIEHPVELPGWQTDITAYLEVADVVLSTSAHESYGASIIEALAAGVAVVAPDVGIAKEAGAIVVPPSGLAQAVIDVLRSNTPGRLKLAVPNAHEWAKQWKETLT